MSYSFEIYGDNRQSIIPKFGVLDVFTYFPGTVTKKFYTDVQLVRLFSAAKIKILGYEFPSRNPTMTEMPVKCSVTSQLALVPADQDLAYSLQNALATATQGRDTTTNAIRVGINSIWSLAAAYRLSLWADSACTIPAVFTIDSNGYFYANYNVMNGNPANFEPFRANFYAEGGPYAQTYGLASSLQSKVDEVNRLTQQITSLPKTRGVELTCSGGNLQSRILILATGVV